MQSSRSVEIVEAFWEEVWNSADPAAVDRFVTEDFVITNAGHDIVGREAFKQLDRGVPGRAARSASWR